MNISLSRPRRGKFPQQRQKGRGTGRWLFVCFWLFASLWAGPALAQDTGPVNGGWPGGASYTIRAGDTLLSVALEMGLDVEQAACLISPSYAWEQPLVISDTLTVPEAPFLCYRVQPGDTLAGIALAHGVTVADIIGVPWNRQGGATVRWLRIPLASDPLPEPLALARPPAATGGQSGVFPPPQSPMPLPANWPYGSGHFAWPVYGWISQDFHGSHSAIDIAAWAGTPVTAADRGVVIRAGWSEIGYGNFVVIDHKIDYITLYAHLAEIAVVEGQVVAQGQLIGTVGSTGNSTGPHLHFEIRDFGRRVNPLGLLGR